MTNIYSTNNHNLSRTDKQIKSDTGSNATTQDNIEVENTTLLQEIAFIQNKSSIKSYLDCVKSEEEKELQMLRVIYIRSIRLYKLFLFLKQKKIV